MVLIRKINFKVSLNRSPLLQLLLLMFAIVSCINDAGSGSRPRVIDQAVIDDSTQNKCAKTQFLTLASETYSCTQSCSTGYHEASNEELTLFKVGKSQTILDLISSAQNVCIKDNEGIRPQDQIFISSYCSCLNGKADIENDCQSFCSSKSITSTPTLYVNVTLGNKILNNTVFKNLYNFCNVQLAQENSKPSCLLSATDGDTTIDNIPVNISKSNNSFTADLSLLTNFNSPYQLKLIESNTGTQSSSDAFVIKRIDPDTVISTSTIAIMPINQYTCFTYGGTVTNGQITRTNMAKIYYYYPLDNRPGTIASTLSSGESQVVCHDEAAFGFKDNASFPRLQLIFKHFGLWSQSDVRFQTISGTQTLNIHQEIQKRMKQEYNIVENKTYFSLLKFANMPNLTNAGSVSTSVVDQGYMLTPFVDALGLAYCPTATEFNSSVPLFKILKSYMSETEGLYIAEKDTPDILTNGTNNPTQVYGTMFITESKLLNYGFYINESGLKIKISHKTSLHNKDIYYYWPFSDTDPLQNAGNTLYRVKKYNALQGNSPSYGNGTITTDKRIGCVPKS